MAQYIANPIIELQKSYLDTEIMRFRTYLAEYVNVEKKKPLHIVITPILRESKTSRFQML